MIEITNKLLLLHLVGCLYHSKTCGIYGREATATCFGCYINHHQAVQCLQEIVKDSRASNIIDEWVLTVPTFGVLKVMNITVVHLIVRLVQHNMTLACRTAEVCRHWSSITNICGVRRILIGFWVVVIYFNANSCHGKIFQLVFSQTIHWHVAPLFIQAYVSLG